MDLGIAGRLTRASIASPLTPLLLIASVLVGLLALAILPREEEPQISVPMVDILVAANGLKAEDAVELVTKPLEDIVKGIDGVEHVYSQSQDNGVVVTARFFVGTSADAAILRVHEEISANLSSIPMGIPEPLIVGRGINDVAMVTLTLAPRSDLAPAAAERWDDNALYNIAEELLHELIKVDDVGLTYIAGGRPNQIRVEPDPERLSLYGVTLNRLVEKIENANRSFVVGHIRNNNSDMPVVAGQTLSGMPDIGLLVIATHDGRPVYVKDVAHIVVGAAPLEHRAWHIEPLADGDMRVLPTVTLAIGKREGANAVVVADRILERLEIVRGDLVPENIAVHITRNYGETALEKADELLLHLGIATVSIVILIGVFVGWRESGVVLVIIPTTILLTFFASYLMGYTINRVSLFALIFSIGILVDDAIVVVENIVRHWRMKPGADPVKTAVEAVAEVGNPTIVATLTVIAALLPMMFVSGLMGPYMAPIPANASAAMLFSFFIAVMIAPWLLIKLGGGKQAVGGGDGGHGHEGRMSRLYRKTARPILKNKTRSWAFLLIVGIATIASTAMFATRSVTVKLLPFDNKSELQVVVDLPEGSSLEATQRVLIAAARKLGGLPELAHIQAYAGTAAPFNFNGLVRHYYLRASPEMGDLQVNLKPKHERDRASHDIALEIRTRLATLDIPEGASIKVVEVPPGPPVLSTLLAEVYGPDAETRRRYAAGIRQAFESVDFIVDTDDSFGRPAQRLRLSIDQDNLEFHGVEEVAVYDTIAALFGGISVGYSHRGGGSNPVEIAISLPKADLGPGERLLSTPIPGRNGIVELGDVVEWKYEEASYPLFRHGGRFAEMVMADMAGQYEAPIYGMFAVEDAIAEMDWGAGGPPEISYRGQPEDEAQATLLWDGEWEITWTTFRDMGGAFIVALLGIYLLVVGQFHSFKLPLVILTPVPLTMVGIVFGHWLFNAPFSATSMIGFIALAGIIVRNSILLVDFIRQEQEKGTPLRAALIEAGAIRFQPIFLTAVAAMIGAAFILADPIFQGLAISLVFGLASST
ncbi:MAG: efflux RND transporter permease subunit, partial [Alphaproteobacteria bacterium]|nr:efflux RND transporter permease subunit [Alphaproteobacteria bacterium]